MALRPCRRARAAAGVLVVCGLLFSATTTRAASPYRLDRAREWVWLGTGAAIGIGGIVLTASTDPLTAEEIAGLDAGDINRFDREGMEPYRDDHAGDALSVTSYFLPLALLARPDARRDAATLGVMWLEATFFNLGVDGICKATVLRNRPYVYDAEAPPELKTSTSARFSFYSGHSASTAMNCFFAASVLSDYIDDGRAEALLWTGAALFPAVTSYLRVDSGHHFRSDVLTGYVTGAAIGWLVPVLHRVENDRFSLHPASVGGSPGLAARVSF